MGVIDKLKKMLTPDEKDSLAMVKKLTKKPRAIKGKDFETGQIIMFSYRAKYDQNPYDAAPMAMILERGPKHTLALNWNWVPPKLRKKMMALIMKKNKKNIEKGLPLDFDYGDVKRILMTAGAPALRKYINKRISTKGVIIPHEYYTKVVNLRSEHFIGISAEDAWKLSVMKKKKPWYKR